MKHAVIISGYNSRPVELISVNDSEILVDLIPDYRHSINTNDVHIIFDGIKYSGVVVEVSGLRLKITYTSTEKANHKIGSLVTIDSQMGMITNINDDNVATVYMETGEILLSFLDDNDTR